MFEYYEIRAVVEVDGQRHDFYGRDVYSTAVGGFVATREGAFEEAMEFRKEHGGRLFWSIYGKSGKESVVVGDFLSYSTALHILTMMLLPMRHAAGLIESGRADKAMTFLSAVCNESTNEDRL